MSGNYLESLYESWGQNFSIDEMLFEHQTEHQHLVIFKNQQWGSVMALDGIIQTTEKDEFIYHEMMTHVPILAHGHAKNILIIGGGDGGILREVVKHSSVEKITQVEIDQAVIDMCVKYFPNHSNGAFSDKRVNIIIDDGLEFIKNTNEKYDVIITDSTDPIGPGESLFRSEFYKEIKKSLANGGVFVAQNGVSFMQLDEMVTSKKRLSMYFEDVQFYSAAVPTYVGGIMLFAWATQNSRLKQVDLKVLKKRFEESKINTRYYDNEIHKASFCLPQYLKTILEAN